MELRLFTDTLALIIEMDILDMMLSGWIWMEHTIWLMDMDGYGYQVFLHGYGWIWIYLIFWLMDMDGYGFCTPNQCQSLDPRPSRRRNLGALTPSP